MYAMPSEVLNGERPGIMGLSIYQVFAAMVAFFVASSLNIDHPVILGVLAVAGIVLARRVRGLYLVERFYHPARWFLLRSIGNDQAQEVLDPVDLYRTEIARRQAATYVVKTPDGRMMTVRG